MSLGERIGKVCKVWLSYMLLLAVALDESLELLAVIPEEWFPMWLKTTLIIGAIAARVGGNATIRKYRRRRIKDNGQDS